MQSTENKDREFPEETENIIVFRDHFITTCLILGAALTAAAAVPIWRAVSKHLRNVEHMKDSLDYSTALLEKATENILLLTRLKSDEYRMNERKEAREMMRKPSSC